MGKMLAVHIVALLALTSFSFPVTVSALDAVV